MSEPVPLVVTGAGGRVGRLLRAAWAEAPPEGLQVIWSMRHGGDLPWTIGAGPAPPLPRGAVVLHLAGTTRGEGVNEAASRALAVCAAAHTCGARHVFVASTAAVYDPGPQPLPETSAPDPRSPYGMAKLQMERAVADRSRTRADAPPVTILRIGNVMGADALSAAIGRGGVVTLDPVEGRAGGPERSCIGPAALFGVVTALARRAVRGEALPPVLNVAQEPPLAMADLLTAAGSAWRWGADNPAVVPRVALDTGLLQILVRMMPATAAGLISEWRALDGARV